MAGSEQRMWAALVKLEMTQDDERLIKFRDPNAYREWPPSLPWQSVSRGLNLTGLHRAAPDDQLKKAA